MNWMKIQIFRNYEKIARPFLTNSPNFTNFLQSVFASF